MAALVLLATVGVVTMLAGIARGEGTGNAENIRCRKLEVVDDKGTVRVRIAVEDDGAGATALTLFGVDGRLGMGIRLRKDGVVSSNMFDEKGQVRLGMDLYKQGRVGIVVRDRNGMDRTRIGIVDEPTAGEAGDATVRILDQSGKVIGAVPAR
jgi:hypothetical protein